MISPASDTAIRLVDLNILSVLPVAATFAQPLTAQEPGGQREILGGPESVTNQLEPQYDLDSLRECEFGDGR